MHHETMTGRERVLRTLRRQSVDRFPIDLGMHFSTGISAFAYYRLREHLGLDPSRIAVADTSQFLARVDEDVLDRFHVDTALLHVSGERTRRWWVRGRFEFDVPEAMQPELDGDGDWVVRSGSASMRMPSGGFFFDGDWIGFDRRSAKEQEDALVAEARRIRDQTTKATMLMGAFGGFVGNDPSWLLRAAEDPDGLAADLDVAADHACRRLGHLIDLLGDCVQVVEVNSDMGAQKAPFISCKTFERISARALTKVCAFIHRHSDWKIFLHSCGSIRPLLPQIIDCGIDALNPVQVAARGMDPAGLKRDFGDRLVFWGGGCDTQGALGTGTPDEVRANVRELCGAFAPGGGFVFNQVHNIMGNVAPENVVAMLDEAYAQSWRFSGNAVADATLSGTMA